MLCEKCQFIQLPHVAAKDPKTGWVRIPHLCLIRHHPNLAALVAAAAAGCAICQYFRPFVEYGQARRRGRAERRGSDCSASDSIGYTHEDPFRKIDRGESTSDGGVLFRGEDEDKPKYYVGPGQYYEEDSESEKYIYLEDDEVCLVPGWRAQEEQVKKDDKAYKKELRRNLARLGLASDHASSRSASDAERKDGAPNHQPSDDAASNTGNNDGASDAGSRTRSESTGSVKSSVDHDRAFSHRMDSERAKKFNGLQWVLSTNDHTSERDQLWITVRSESQSSEFSNSGADDVASVTLTAGSIANYALEDDPEICLNGVAGYSKYTLAALYPGLWKYRVDNLCLPQKRPRRNKKPVLEFYQRRDQVFPTVPHLQGREIIEDPASPAVTNLARSWLEKCVNDHDKCKLKGEVVSPSRLIDVGDSSAEYPVKLHEVGAEETEIRYATLTHCWGPDRGTIKKLLKANLQSMLQELVLGELPKNFRDAIFITRSLGLRYVWIDALCIIQDDTKDWAAEAGKMGEYYRGSTLTISALASPDVQHGILQARPVLQSPPRINVDGGTLYLRPLLSDTLSVTDSQDMSDRRRPMVTQPLNARAWTLQERLFSRRILYFTEEQLIWQCRCRFFSEDGQYVANEKNRTERFDRDIVDIINLKDRVVKKGDVKKYVRPSISSTQWYALVKFFTQRQITYHTDRLPALSGLAQEVGKLTGARYVAGLWFGSPTTIKIGLLWQPCQRRWNGDVREPARAANSCPSWSWASLDAEIEFPLADDASGIRPRPELDFKLIRAVAPPSTSDSFGGVTSGRLVLEAWTCRYNGVATYKTLLADAEKYDRHEDTPPNPESNNENSPAADSFVEFDVKMPDDLYRCDMEDWRTFRSFRIIFICFINEFEGEDDDLQFVEQKFLVLEDGVKQGKAKGCKRVGVASTPSGILFKIDKEHGWERKNITIF